MTRHWMGTQLRAEEWRDARSGFRGWRVRITGNRGIPTPAVMAGRVFVGAGFGSHEVHAFDALTGADAWRLHTRDDGPTAAVAFDGFVAFNTESCTLEVVEADSGRVIWERWLGDPLLAQPAIAVDRVLMVFPRDGTHVLGAFDLASGAPLWETRVGHDVITAPIVAEGKAYLSTFDGALQAIDLATGEQLWRRAMNATSAPWVYKGEVFVAQRARESHEHRGESSRRREPLRDESPATAAPAEGPPVERSTHWSAASGELRGEFAGKPAAYLSASWGAARKREYQDRKSVV